MKKTVALALMLLLSVASLSACTPHEHVVKEWVCHEGTHWPHVVCTWERCDIDVLSGPCTDKNGDGVCDVCSYEKKVD